MTPAAVIVRSALAPVQREPSIRSEQLTQLVLGETGSVLETKEDWRRVRLDLDGYEGWLHRGYALGTTAEAAAAWRAEAQGWSEGAEIGMDQLSLRLPLRARVVSGTGGIRLPDGRTGVVLAGRVATAAGVERLARGVPAVRWAAEHFSGAPYEWGGVTPWGVDCSGLVQTTFLARGVRVPRDAAVQAGVGQPVDLGEIRVGDLLFFAEREGRISHVAFAGAQDTLVHSTLACGGFVIEPWHPGSRAAYLRAQLVAVRRLTPTGQRSPADA